MMQFIYDLTLFGQFGYGVQTFLVIVAVGHWVEFFRLRSRIPNLSKSKIKLLLVYLRSNTLTNWTRLDNARLDNGELLIDHLGGKDSPLVSTVLEALEEPNRLRDNENWRLILELEIQKKFYQTTLAAVRIKSSAPAWGMFFTVVGIMLAVIEYGESSSVKQMLGSVGPAMGTTALGALTAIIERNLIDGRLIPMQLKLFHEGVHLLLGITDLYNDTAYTKETRAVAKHDAAASLPKVN